MSRFILPRVYTKNNPQGNSIKNQPDTVRTFSKRGVSEFNFNGPSCVVVCFQVLIIKSSMSIIIVISFCDSIYIGFEIHDFLLCISFYLCWFGVFLFDIVFCILFHTNVNIFILNRENHKHLSEPSF